MRKKFICAWCKGKFEDAREHKCPEIFIHSIEPDTQPQEIIIRGDYLDIRWNKKGEIIIFKQKTKKNDNRKKM